MTDAAERQKRFDALREQTGRLLRLPPDHPVVVRRAGDWLMYEGGLTGYIETGHIDLRAYVQLSELNERNQPAPPIPDARVEIEVVERKGKPDEVRYGYGEKPPGEPADGAAAPSSDNPPTAEAVEPLPDNITRLPDGRASWTRVVSHGLDPNKPRPFSKPDPEVIRRREIGRNASHDIHDEYVRQYSALRSTDLRSRSEQARTDVRDPFVGAVGGTGRRNPFSHDTFETNPNYAQTPVLPQPVPPKESA